MSIKFSFLCFDGCPFILDASCVDYTGPDLNNLFNMPTDSTLEEIIQSIDALTFVQTPFTAIGTNSIIAIAGGTIGHSPEYRVRRNPSANNAITSSTDGLKVTSSSIGDGKVKVNAGDTKDYLENQIDGDTDGIVTINIQKIGGKLRFVPAIDIDALLDEIENNHLTTFCSMINDCIPKGIKTFTSSTTTTTTIPT